MIKALTCYRPGDLSSFSRTQLKVKEESCPHLHTTCTHNNEQLGAVTHTFNPSIQGNLYEFKVSLLYTVSSKIVMYIERPYFKKQKVSQAAPPITDIKFLLFPQDSMPGNDFCRWTGEKIAQNFTAKTNNRLEMTQWLRDLAALAQDSGSVSSTPMVVHNHL